VPNEELIALALAATNASNNANSDEIDEIQSRHIKGCNCKKSNCLKRYCECYLAKIQCSTLCKCVGCKNCDESTKNLIQLANAPPLRNNNNKSFQQHQNLTQVVKNSKTFNSHHMLMDSSNSWRNNNSLNRTNDLNSFNSLDLLTRASQDHYKMEQQQNLKLVILSF